MPELPEVQTVATRLDGALRGAKVSRVRLFRTDVVKRGPGDLSDSLEGKSITRIGRHGKRLIWTLEPDAELVFHLGMTGNLVLAEQDAPLPRHTHMVISFDGLDREVRFRDPRRFGGVWLAGDRGAAATGRFSASLGPDALQVRLAEFRRIMSRRRQVKAVLLDQSVIAGLGNIYCDEALHLARIHPLTRASSLRDDRVTALLRSVRRVLRAAIAAGGSSLRDYCNADGEPGWFQVRHRVYGREGLACRRCGARIRRITVASRSTHVCPRCQRR